MTTIDKKEIEKFSQMASDWWNPNGKFKPLHLFNPARIKFIKEKLIYHFKLNSFNQKPLEKLNDKEYAEWTENKEKLLKLIELDQLSYVLKQPTYVGWKNLFQQLKVLIECDIDKGFSGREQNE